MEIQNQNIMQSVDEIYSASEHGANPGHGKSANDIRKAIYFARGGPAEKVIELAMQNDVPIHQNLELLTQLSNLEFLDNVPDELNAAVAEILSFIYRVNGNQTKARGAVNA